MTHLSESNATFYSSLHGSSIDKSPAERGLLPGCTVTLYVPGNNNKPTAVATAKLPLSMAQDDTHLRRHLHGHDLPQDEFVDLVVIYGVNLFPECERYEYTYTFITTDDIPDTLGEMHKSVFYVWDTRAMISATVSGTST